MNKTWKLAFLLPLLFGCGGGNSSESTSEEVSSESTSEEVPYIETLDWNTLAPSETLEGGKLRLTDMVGRKVKVTPGSYERVLCIGAGALRLYSYVGDIDKICAVEDIDNLALTERPKMFDGVARPYMVAYGEDLKGLPTCGIGGPQNQKIEKEKILACSPDLIISEYEDAEKSDDLQATAGVPVLTLDYGSGSSLNASVYGSLVMLGKALGTEAKAKSLVTYCNDSVKAIFETTKGVTKKKAYVAGLGNWGTANAYSTSPNFEAFIYAHVDNVVKNRPTGGVQTIDPELFLSLASEMDIMVFDAASVKNIKGQGLDFSSCAAFKNGQVYLQMAYNAYYTNVETSLINCWFVAKTVYPERFQNLEISAKADEVYQKFLGKTLYSSVLEYPFSYGGYQQISNPTEFFA